MVTVLGIGSAVTDILAHVPESFIPEHAGGEKGGRRIVTLEEFSGIRKKLDRVVRVPGGSAANTLAGLLHTGIPCRLLAKTGRDADGRFFEDSFSALGADLSSMKHSETLPTACCISLVTPDAERTMCTFLGAGADLSSSDLSSSDFDGIGLVLLEGYLLESPSFFHAVLEQTAKRKIPVALDLSSFGIVRKYRRELFDILRESVDIVFANEEEASALIGENHPEKALDELCSLCGTAAVKLGAEGALLGHHAERVHVPAVSVKAVDTTGAGDLWASGFLYGYLNGMSLEKAGRIGALTGAAAVQVPGASVPEEQWNRIREQMNKIQTEGK